MRKKNYSSAIDDFLIVLFKNKFRIESTRLSDWDYSSPGYYFVTICVKNRICCLGSIRNGNMILSEQGKIVRDHWSDLINHYNNIGLDEFVVMPNHIHGIIEIKNNNNVVDTICDHAKSPVPVETIHELSLQGIGRNYELKNNRNHRRNMLLFKIIGRFNMQSSKQINLLQNTIGHSFWQSRCYDHVIRNEKALSRIRQYIFDNPIKWTMDKYYPKEKPPGSAI